MLDAEENAESATDNEDGPVWVKRESAQLQKEEEEEDEDDIEDKQRPAGHQPEAELNPSDQDSDRECEEESPKAQTAERRSKRGASSRRKATRRISRISHDTSPASKRRKAVSLPPPCVFECLFAEPSQGCATEARRPQSQLDVGNFRQ